MCVGKHYKTSKKGHYRHAFFTSQIKCCLCQCVSLEWIKTFGDFTHRAHVCCVSDDCGAHGMERNIGDQLNKAFEAYRQVSIEKDNAKKELQQMVRI